MESTNLATDIDLRVTTLMTDALRGVLDHVKRPDSQGRLGIEAVSLVENGHRIIRGGTEQELSNFLTDVMLKACAFEALASRAADIIDDVRGGI